MNDVCCIWTDLHHCMHVKNKTDKFFKYWCKCEVSRNFNSWPIHTTTRNVFMFGFNVFPYLVLYLIHPYLSSLRKLSTNTTAISWSKVSVLKSTPVLSRELCHVFVEYRKALLNCDIWYMQIWYMQIRLKNQRISHYQNETNKTSTFLALWFRQIKFRSITSIKV